MRGSVGSMKAGGDLGGGGGGNEEVGAGREGPQCEYTVPRRRECGRTES